MEILTASNMVGATTAKQAAYARLLFASAWVLQARVVITCTLTTRNSLPSIVTSIIAPNAMFVNNNQVWSPVLGRRCATSSAAAPGPSQAIHRQRPPSPPRTRLHSLAWRRRVPTCRLFRRVCLRTDPRTDRTNLRQGWVRRVR